MMVVEFAAVDSFTNKTQTRYKTIQFRLNRALNIHIYTYKENALQFIEKMYMYTSCKMTSFLYLHFGRQ